MKKIGLLLFLWSLSSGAVALSPPQPPIFKISIYGFPQTLEPQKQGSNVSYLFQNLFRNLFIYKGQGRIEPDMASKCLRKNKGKTFQCRLRKDLKWSDGSVITAQDFLETYQRILDPANKSQRPDFLFPVKNAKEIFEGQKKIKDLGIAISAKGELVFELNFADSEFEYNLSTFYLSPTKGSYDFKSAVPFLTNGPYKIKSWVSGQSLLVEGNSFYPGRALRPFVKFINIEEDSVALRLYDKKELDFVRRLPTLLISKYQTRKDFFSLPVLRFDYLAFGGELKNLPELRKTLATSLNYDEWQTLLSSVGRPGCPGFPSKWLSPERPCFQQSKHELFQVSIPLLYTYSLQGGDDHRRTAEWLQSEWKKNLGLSFQIRGLENKTYVSEIKKNPPSVYRKGLAPDRPTCSGIMESFTTGHPENYIQNQSPDFDKIVQEMRKTLDQEQKKILCRKALDFLLDDYKMIPTGPYNISLLASPDFTGWSLNELNQLDLDLLQASVIK